MPLPIVVVAIEKPAPPPRLARELIAACTQAVAPGHCELAPGGSQASRWAHVSWLDEHRDHALVEVGAPNQERGAWQFRRVRFERADLPEQRWRAIGYTIAGLAAEPEKAPLDAEPSTTPEADSVSLTLNAAGLVGSGFSGTAAAGTAVQAALRWQDFPLFPSVFGAWRNSAQRGVTGNWWDVGVALGGFVSLGPIELSANVGAVLDHLALHVGPDGEDRLLPGLLLGADMTWPATGPLGLFLGGRWLQLTRPTEIFVEETRSAYTDTEHILAFFGLTVRL